MLSLVSVLAGAPRLLNIRCVAVIETLSSHGISTRTVELGGLAESAHFEKFEHVISNIAHNL